MVESQKKQSASTSTPSDPSKPSKPSNSPSSDLTRVGSSLAQIFSKPSSTAKESPHSVDKRKIDENASLPPLETIYVHPIALSKMFWMAEAVYSVFHEPYEIYALCLGKDRHIYDIIIPNQSVNYASVHIPSTSLVDLKIELLNTPYEVLGWTHSHANFSVFFSGTDNMNQNVILHDTANYTTIQGIQVKYVYGMTVNLNHQVYGVVTTQYPSGEIVHQPARIRVEGTYPSSWDYQAARAELSDMVQLKTGNSHSHSRKHRKSVQKPPHSFKPKRPLRPEGFQPGIPAADALTIDQFLKAEALQNSEQLNFVIDPGIKSFLHDFLQFQRRSQNQTPSSSPSPSSSNSQTSSSPPPPPA